MQKIKNLKENLYLKIAIITALILLLLIPTAMIQGLITERESTQDEAIAEVSNKWGKKQTIAGPVITIPYLVNGDTKRYYHILPNELNIASDVSPQKRYRGVYEIVVYDSEISLAGTFNDLSMADTDIDPEDILFDKAFVSVGISDLRGIEKQVELNWAGKKYPFNPGTVTNKLFRRGISVPVALEQSDSSSYNFSFDLSLKGSQELFFAPVGKVTNIDMASSWPNPSFNGEFLPDTRNISADGFTANWNVLNLNRKYPQSWKGGDVDILASAFGVELLLPVDGYHKSLRSIKYAILFVALTFLVFFFVEVLKKTFIHPMQYLLVGLALILFYSLLLSFSEYLAYNTAFLISASATLLLVTGYVKAILKSYSLAGLIGSILAILYTFIFVIIQMQDFSLLIGSVGMFLVLGLVMYFSRKIDWYGLSGGAKSSEGELETVVGTE